MGVTPLVLTVDRNKRNLELLAQFLAKEGYQTRSVSTLEDFEQALEHVHTFGLALIDISGFDRSIWQYCEKLSDHGVPILIVSPQNLSRIRQESFSHGAQEVLF